MNERWESLPTDHHPRESSQSLHDQRRCEVQDRIIAWNPGEKVEVWSLAHHKCCWCLDGDLIIEWPSIGRPVIECSMIAVISPNKTRGVLCACFARSWLGGSSVICSMVGCGRAVSRKECVPVDLNTWNSREVGNRTERVRRGRGSRMCMCTRNRLWHWLWTCSVYSTSTSWIHTRDAFLFAPQTLQSQFRRALGFGGATVTTRGRAYSWSVSCSTAVLHVAVIRGVCYSVLASVTWLQRPDPRSSNPTTR